MHGNGIVVAGADEPDRRPPGDAILTTQGGIAVCVRVADCVPILLAARVAAAGRGRTVGVAAVHAGWRGVVAGVVARSIGALCEACGTTPSHLVAAVGPSIAVEHVEGGDEVAVAFDQAGLAEAVDRQPRIRPHVDLRAAVVRQLTDAGLLSDAIDVSDRCTWRDAGEFFSHRRDKGRTGRMAAVIALSL